VSIHTSDPFATPDDAKSSLRRLRGRLPAAVTLWTALGGDARPAGLTVSSTVVVDGEPGRLLGVIDPESDLYAAVQASGRFAMTVLRASDRRVADIFAGIMPAAGGPFRDGWVQTAYGPVPVGSPSWAGCRLDATAAVGWGVLVTATVEAVRLGDDDPPLVHYRGRYADGPQSGPA
jgi:flavin reductase (DIM6/NTAB) family NADH-FMN oxidoreductase RutF